VSRHFRDGTASVQHLTFSFDLLPAGTITRVDSLSPKTFLLHEEAEFLIVNKPAWIPVLPDGWEKDAPWLVRLLEPEYGKVWVVHRLDKVTSGVMLFARTAEAHRALSLQFEGHEVRKLYHALVNGLPAWEQHTARHPLRVDVGHSHRSVVDNSRGKASETGFHVLERFEAASLLEALPATGRTHQIRVHAYALGLPLLADTLYSAPPTALIARPALHAYSLSFDHPTSGERLTFTAPYPPDFQHSLEELRGGGS
jgi:tRNA pseudouridine32 synthase/23S rRNA pseudouridine746 synthase